MAARSRDQSKIPGSGAPVLMVPHHPTKFQKFLCNGFLKVARQKINGIRRKKKKKKMKMKKKKKNLNDNKRGPSPIGLGP